MPTATLNFSRGTVTRKKPKRKVSSALTRGHISDDFAQRTFPARPRPKENRPACGRRGRRRNWPRGQAAQSVPAAWARSLGFRTISRKPIPPFNSMDSLGSKQAERDYVVREFLYNTGARVEEAALVTIGDLTWGCPSSVRLVGKGNKIRHQDCWLDQDCGGQPWSARKSVPESSRTTADSVWYLHIGTTSCEACEQDDAVSQSQTHQSAYGSTFDCLSFAPCGCRHQHYPWLDRTRVARHYPRILCAVERYVESLH